MTEVTITDFMNTRYKEFSLYTLMNRAIMSVVDGFKPTHRKVIHVSQLLWKNGDEKPIKVFQLAGKVASDCFYHHGNSSLEGSIVGMAQTFKNNLPLLEPLGQYGSLREPNHSAPRYLSTKLSSNFRLLYKDFDLLNYKQEEGYDIEPNYFLPIIPTILLNGSKGIAVGFSMNILNRDPIDLINACESVLKGKEITYLKPHNNFFKGEWVQDINNHKKWIIKGRFNRKNTTTVIITELPISQTYESYEKILDSLLENKTIVSYDNNCSDDINYEIKFTRESLASYTDDDLIKLLKLEESETEIFTTLDENGLVKIFESDVEIVNYFVNYRLTYYYKRKDKIISDLKKEMLLISNRGKFIKAIIEDKLIINKRPKQDIIEDLIKMNLSKIDNSYDYLLRMPISSLTKENYEKIKKDWLELKEKIEVIEKTDPKDMYFDDLKELKKKLTKNR